MKPPALLVLLLALSPFALTACDALEGLTGSRAKKSAEKGSESQDEESEEKKPKKKKSKKSEGNQEPSAKVTASAPVVAPAEALDPFVQRHLALVRTAASCDDKGKAMAAWCLAAEGYATGTAAELPATSTRLGVTTFVVTQDASRATLDKHTHLSSLAVRKADSGYALISEVKPDNAAERAESIRVAKLVFDHFSGKTVQLAANAGMASYLDKLPLGKTYPMSKQAGGYRLEGGSNANLRRVGNAWVSVEVPKNNPAGMWLSVFTDLPYR